MSAAPNTNMLQEINPPSEAIKRFFPFKLKSIENPRDAKNENIISVIVATIYKEKEELSLLLEL